MQFHIAEMPVEKDKGRKGRVVFASQNDTRQETGVLVQAAATIPYAGWFIYNVFISSASGKGPLPREPPFCGHLTGWEG